MCNRFMLSLVIVGMAQFTASTARAVVPAPPVNQSIGMRDVLWGTMTATDCRACHGNGLQDRHHELYGKTIPAGSHVPYPDADGNGIPDTTYSCISCHGQTFTREVNCVVCHTASPHHEAGNSNCKSCHGSIVDNRNDGHYIPTYSPSLVTPTPSGGDGLPPNSRGKGAGACNYCHDSDGLAPPIIRNSSDLHHGKGFDCQWCHVVHGGEPIRVCEGCHGPKSLHNIQADSPQTPTGTIVVGGELAGYGHIGRDMEPGDSDCWGCHGFALASAPDSGPLIPTVYNANKATITAGRATPVVLAGAAFTNTTDNAVYESTVTLTAADGASVVLTPDIIVDQGALTVTIPSTTVPGNYVIKAKKVDFESNPVVVSVIPKVRITKATAAWDKTVTITGAGFAGYQAGAGLFVNGANSAGKIIRGTVLSWTPEKIVARFGSAPTKVNVKSVFGKASHAVVIP